LPEDVVAPLVDELLTLLRDEHLDYTSFFRSLSRAADAPRPAVVLTALDAWRQRWQALSPNSALIIRANPVYIPRNHLVEESLEAATSGDLEPLQRLLGAVTRPYDERPSLERYAHPAPEDFGPYRTFCGT
jgi:serine/tyrosine/threonine adenylyltransferase